MLSPSLAFFVEEKCGRRETGKKEKGKKGERGEDLREGDVECSEKVR